MVLAKVKKMYFTGKGPLEPSLDCLGSASILTKDRTGMFDTHEGIRCIVSQLLPFCIYATDDHLRKLLWVFVS